MQTPFRNEQAASLRHARSPGSLRTRVASVYILYCIRKDVWRGQKLQSQLSERSMHGKIIIDEDSAQQRFPDEIEPLPERDAPDGRTSRFSSVNS